MHDNNHFQNVNFQLLMLLIGGSYSRKITENCYLQSHIYRKQTEIIQETKQAKVREVKTEFTDVACYIQIQMGTKLNFP